MPQKKKKSAAELKSAAKSVDVTSHDYQVTLETSAGAIRLDLDAQVAPGHVRNFVALTESGFYDDCCFHRVIKGFMIQGGCPEGTGRGGPGYTIEAEFNATKHVAGVLSMARTSDPDSAGCQFFLCLENASHLNNQYTAFGKTADAESLLVVTKIGLVATGSGDKPLDPVIITRATVKKSPKKKS